MRRYFSLPWLTGILLLLLVNNVAWAAPAPRGIDPPVVKALEGSKGQLKIDSFVVVEDAKFFDTAYNALLKPGYPVKNIISFEINEEANIPIPGNFETWVRVRVTYTKADHSTSVVDTSLKVGYNKESFYRNRHTYVFDNAYRVEIKILEVKTGVSPEIWKTLRLVNQLQSSPQYNFDCTGNAVTAIHDSAWAPNTQKDELPVYWAPSIGADEYDLEWTYIDSSALASGLYGPVGSPNAALIFDNNASRVTITGTYYKIPLIYDNKGHLFCRVRPVQWQANGGRTEAYWSSDFTGGLGKFDYNGHERPLSWQATTTFAEEGKRKTVLQYYDGSLRARQTVTKDNSTENTIVAESFYDYQGRPVIQVLPAPTLNSVIGYSKNFNRGLNTSTGYDKSLFDTLASADMYCNASAPPMDSSTGAAQYYSPSNPLAPSGFHKYIPDAKGYPFTEVEYTQDNTGRISRQSGVGETFRMGSGHETRYFYGTADQRELDALFGTEVGLYSHYFKTMVRDANGQYSVSYTDMRGRTIATALAGATPDSIKLDTLSSYRTAMLTEKLSDPASTVIKDLVMESKKGLLVSKAGEHLFTYQLDPQSLAKDGCSAQVCYECLYDLQITITDDCNNQKLGGAPFDTVVHNFQMAAIDTSCNSNSGGFSFSFTKFLPEGSYEVTKQLSVSRYGLDYYRDSIFMKTNTCKNLQDFIQEQRQLLAGVLQCRPTCQGCNDSLGTWEQFRERFRIRSGIAESDMPGYENMAQEAYNKSKEDCNALCDSAVSEFNDIRRNMLMDMTPSSGQYANLDKDDDVLSVFFSSVDGDTPDTTAKYTQVTYKDANGNPDLVYDETAGKLVPPQELDAEVFAQKFKLSWAEALLPLHPEYCKLEKYQLLKSSHEWDKRFAETDTYAEALAKGYLNPVRHGDIPARFTGGQTEIQDPLSTFNSSAFQIRLKDSLLKYRNIGSNVSLYAVASLTVMCKEGPNSTSCLNNYTNINNAFNTTNMCAGELDMAWRAFRQMYLDVKRQIINQWINSQCTTSLTATALMTKGYAPHFSDAPELNKASGAGLPPNTTQAQQEVAQQMAGYYDANCRAYATQWIQQLGSCYPADSLTNVIIPRLIQVCKEGSDADHPYGASSVKPSSTYTFRSFEEVINNYNQTHGITDYINCNAWKITAPKPYDKQAPFGNKPIYTKPSECECSSITAYYNKYKNTSGYSSFADYLKKVYNTHVADSALNLMLGLCNVPSVPAVTCNYVSSPLFLPPAFQCYTGDICITCEQFTAADHAFRTQFPGIYPVLGTSDSIQIRNNRLYEEFMNHRFGFAKRIDEYLAFAGSCGMPVDSTAALRDIVNGYKTSLSAGNSWHYVGDGFQVTDVHQLIRDGQIKLPDSFHTVPAYCCVSPVHYFGKTVCLPDGYQIEARIKTVGWLLTFMQAYSADAVSAGGFNSTFNSDGNTIVGGNIMDGRGVWQSGQTIATVPGSLADWHIIKVKVTRTGYEQYVDGQLIQTFQKVPELYGKPVGPITGLYLSFATMQAAVDWVKLSDHNGVSQYLEDFNDPNNLSKENGNAYCPAATCTTDFANYFNQQKAANYSYFQIDSIYRASGIVLDVCTPGNSKPQVSPEQLVKDFNANYQSNYGATITFTTQEEEHFTDLHHLIHDGRIQLPDTIRARPGEWYNPVGITANGPFFNWTSGYAIEYRMKYLQDLLSGHVFYINFNSEPIGLVISRYESGIYLSGIQTNGNNKFGSDNGGALFDFKLITSDPNALLDWNNYKIQVELNAVSLYYNDVFIIQVPRDPVPIPCGGGSGLGLRGRHGAVDWIKLYDGNNQVRYFEDFLDPDNPAVTDANYRCGHPVPDCQSAFAQYYNQQYGTSYTFSQISSLYTGQGIDLNVCGTSTSCASLQRVKDNYHNNVENRTPTFKFNGNYGRYPNHEVIPFSPEIVHDGVAAMPLRYQDSATIGYSHLNLDWSRCSWAVGAKNRFTIEWKTKATYTTAGHVFFYTDGFGAYYRISTIANGYQIGLHATNYGGESGPGGDVPVDTLANGFNDWVIVKLRYDNGKYQFIINDKVVREFTSSNRTAYISRIHSGCGPVTDFRLDWIKIYDENDEVKYFEDFTGSAMTKLPPDLITECDTSNCQQNFASYFNQQQGTSYSFAQIESLYKNCGIGLNICGTTAPQPVPSTCTFQKTYGGSGTDIAHDMQPTADQGHIMAGYTTSFGNGGMDAYVVKTDKKGNVLWSKTYGGSNQDVFNKIKPTADGGYIAVGYTQSFHQAQEEIFVVKMDASGNVTWSKGLAQNTANGEIGFDIIQTSDGGYVVVGTYNYTPGGADWEVLRLAADGTVIWGKRLGSTNSDQAFGIVEDNDTLVVTGIVHSSEIGNPSTYYNGCIIKLNKANGDVIWLRTYDVNTPRSSWFNGIFKTGTGYRLTVTASDDFQDNNIRLATLDVDKNGNVTRLKRSPAVRNNVNSLSMYPTADGGYIAAQGHMGANSDISLSKTDVAGNVQWTNLIKQNGHQYIYKIVEDAGGSFTGAGSSDSDVLLLNVSNTGKSNCEDSAGDFSNDNIGYITYTNSSLDHNTTLSFSNTAISVTGLNAATIVNSLCVTGNCFTTGPTLCGRAEPVFPPMTLEDIDNCSDSAFFIASKAQELYQVYVDSLKGSFDSSYIARCLEAYKAEKFTVRHQVNEFHHTLYYYDQAGNLLKTVPPAGVRANFDSLWLDSVTVARVAGSIKTPKHQLVTQYRYNTLNQVISQQSPDGGKSDFWYDRLGRLSISQNARQKANSTTEDNRQYSYTKYDTLGRIIEVGQVSNTAANGPISNTITRNETSLKNWLSALDQRRAQITRTVYDVVYTGFNPAINRALIVSQRNLRNRVSYTTYTDTAPATLGNHHQATFYTYDISGNVDTLLQDYGNSTIAGVENVMNANINRYKKIVYKYDLISGKVNMVMYQRGWRDGFYHRYSYDAENRLTLVETSTDSLVWEKEARYEYYRHGPLARVVLGHQQVQGMDYAYTLQGWLKGINSTGGTTKYDMGGDGDTASLNRYTAADAIGLTLNYFTGDYATISGHTPFPGYSAFMPVGAYRPLFNGNISSQSVYQKKFESSSPGGPLIFYNYKYDQLNRLVSQDAFNGFNRGNNNWNGLASMGEWLKERIAYDANGNILKYLRNSLGGSTHQMDSLNYHYYAGTNQLRRITDNVPANANTGYVPDIENQLDNNYRYDSIGNLISDNAEGITNIKWNVYGKIQEISRTATTALPATNIKYTYDALGNRISQVVTHSNGMKYYTWYVRDAQGNALSTYAAEGTVGYGQLRLFQQDRYIYGSSRLGSYSYQQLVDGVPPNTIDTFMRGYRQYELTNHLGNVLAVVSDKRIGVPFSGDLIDHYEPEIVSATDYYPFGMPSRLALGSGKAYRFGFNGKENDNDVKGYGSQQDYGMRIYDPRVGRFLSVDPLTRSYPMLTPYQFASNRPIDGIDLDGQEFLKTIPKFEYSGENNWVDYVSAIDNGVIGLVNLVPTTWNSIVATTQSLKRGTYIKDLTGEAKQAASAIKQTTKTFIKEPFKTLASPESVEFFTNAFVGAKVFTPGTNTGNLLNLERKIGSTEKVIEKTAVANSGRLTIPQGLTAEEFTTMSQMIRNKVGQLSDDIVVQGSRASGTASAASDIDIAIKMSAKDFSQFLLKQFKKPNPGSAAEKTMFHAIETGKIQAGEAGLSGFRKELEKLLGMQVDISVIKTAGKFDNGVQLPIEK